MEIDSREARALIEHPLPHVGEAVGHVNASQVGTVLERVNPEGGDPFEIMRLVRLEQRVNAAFPMLVAEIVRLARPEQPENANSSRLVTLLGMMTLVKLVQKPNAKRPRRVTLLGSSTLARLVHPANAQSPILVTPFGIVTLVRLLHPSKAMFAMLVIRCPSSRVGMVTAPPGPTYRVRMADETGMKAHPPGPAYPVLLLLLGAAYWKSAARLAGAASHVESRIMARITEPKTRTTARSANR